MLERRVTLGIFAVGGSSWSLGSEVTTPRCEQLRPKTSPLSIDALHAALPAALAPRTKDRADEDAARAPAMTFPVLQTRGRQRQVQEVFSGV